MGAASWLTWPATVRLRGRLHRRTAAVACSNVDIVQGLQASRRSVASRNSFSSSDMMRTLRGTLTKSILVAPTASPALSYDDDKYKSQHTRRPLALVAASLLVHRAQQSTGGSWIHRSGGARGEAHGRRSGPSVHRFCCRLQLCQPAGWVRVCM